MAYNISGVAEPGEARLPSAPPGEAAKNRPPESAETRRDKRECRAPQAPLGAKERSGLRLVKRRSTGRTGPQRIKPYQCFS